MASASHNIPAASKGDKYSSGNRNSQPLAHSWCDQAWRRAHPQWPAWWGSWSGSPPREPTRSQLQGSALSSQTSGPPGTQHAILCNHGTSCYGHAIQINTQQGWGNNLHFVLDSFQLMPIFCKLDVQATCVLNHIKISDMLKTFAEESVALFFYL